jgi:hypothetical protein
MSAGASDGRGGDERPRGFEADDLTAFANARGGGVVSRVIVGRNHRLALRPETRAGAEAWIENQRTRWERLFDVVAEYLEEER